RWAGPDKDFRRAMQAVEDKLRERGALARSQRKAHFVCALCLAWPDGHVEEFEAKVDGTLIWPPRGEKGFGYDPMFLPTGHSRTFGEMTNVEKHGLPPRGKGLSHRARAFLKLAEACLAPRCPQRRSGVRRLYPLAVLPVEVSVLRLQQSCAPRRCRRSPLHARLCRRDRRNCRARARANRLDDLLRRRHAVADAACNRRCDP